MESGKSSKANNNNKENLLSHRLKTNPHRKLTFCVFHCLLSWIISLSLLLVSSGFVITELSLAYTLLKRDLDKSNRKSFEVFHSFMHPAAAWVDYPRKQLMMLSGFIYYSKPQDLTVAFVSELIWFYYFRGEQRGHFNHMAMNRVSFSNKTAHEVFFTKVTVRP